MMSPVGRTKEQKQYVFFKWFIFFPLVGEGLFLLAAIIYRVMGSPSMANNVIQVAAALALLYVLAALVFVIGVFAKEQAAQSYTHGAIYRTSATIEEQLELRRKAIAGEQGAWIAGMIMLACAFLLLLANLSVMLISDVLLYPLFLITVVVTVSSIVVMRRRLSWQQQSSAATAQERVLPASRKTASISYSTVSSSVKLDVSIERILKIALVGTLGIGLFFMLTALLEFLGLFDFPNIYTINPPEGVPFLFSLVAFVVIMIIAFLGSFYLLVIGFLILVLVGFIYDWLMRKLPRPRLETRTDALIRSFIVISVLGLVLVLIDLYNTVILNSGDLMTFAANQLSLILLMVIEGLLMGVVWWHDVVNNEFKPMLMRRATSSSSTRGNNDK